MIEVTRERWNKIPSDYKGEWSNLIVTVHGMPVDWVGRKNVMSQMIKGEGGTALLTEGIHFTIID